MSETYPGKLMTSTFLSTTLRENMHRVMENYVGVTVSHYRRSGELKRDFYGEYRVADPEFLGEALLHISPQDYDTINNLPHTEGIIPIEVLLDPTDDWRQGDEIGIAVNIQGIMVTRRLKIGLLNSESHDNVTIYHRANLVPIREDRDGCELE